MDRSEVATNNSSEEQALNGQVLVAEERNQAELNEIARYETDQALAPPHVAELPEDVLARSHVPFRARCSSYHSYPSSHDLVICMFRMAAHHIGDASCLVPVPTANKVPYRKNGAEEPRPDRYLFKPPQTPHIPPVATPRRIPSQGGTKDRPPKL